MSLDYHFEADEELSLEQVEAALIKAGWNDIDWTENIITALAPGFTIHSELYTDPKSIMSENTKGLSFPVYLHSYIRTRGPHSDEIFEGFLTELAGISKANFLVSFQFESLIFWRDSDGLHKA